ncbi:unnamed protein product [Strongylus vulgaris]|uniref:Uncharacterized protein n=1 Tax=Strongylus vulgaris TaxID=40348 RepID=A0A3P7J240_STRVU|nr:unnamed protein product [Strongylus vulgaris]
MSFTNAELRGVEDDMVTAKLQRGMRNLRLKLTSEAREREQPSLAVQRTLPSEQLNPTEAAIDRRDKDIEHGDEVQLASAYS